MAFTTGPILTPNAVPDILGARKVSLIDVTADGSYAAGGAPVTAAAFGLNFIQYSLEATIITPSGTGTAVDVIGVPQTDGSLKLKLLTATGEIANASNSGAVIRVSATGY